MPLPLSLSPGLSDLVTEVTAGHGGVGLLLLDGHEAAVGLLLELVQQWHRSGDVEVGDHILHGEGGMVWCGVASKESRES